MIKCYKKLKVWCIYIHEGKSTSWDMSLKTTDYKHIICYSHQSLGIRGKRKLNKQVDIKIQHHTICK